ncbi:MAG: PAS domain-containing sensor histidine kinase [Proteobacteria bacterium]|nr:PAS domain-containing sensor histidine kinase [Pseudomonadota bacterium]
MSRHSDLTPAMCGERRFRAIFDASPDCIKLVSAECRLIDMNAAGLRMIEADSVDQVRGRSLFELIDPAYHRIFRDGVDAVFAGKATQMQFEVIGRRGSRLFMDQTAAPLFSPDDPSRAIEMVAVTRNISAQRRAEVDLLQARLAQEVARSAAHHAGSLGQKLKTPLHTIIGYGEMLLEAAQEAEREREVDDARHVLDAAAELSSLLNQLLKTTLAETRKNSPANDVDDFLDMIAAVVRPLAEANGNRINIEIDPHCASLPTDKNMLAQSLKALLSYAVSNTRNGIITMKARSALSSDPPRIAFSVIDSGKGLSVAELDALFGTSADEAVEGPPSFSSLAAARRLAMFMGGDIKATSAPGRGSRFTLEVPIREPASRAWAPASG